MNIYISFLASRPEVTTCSPQHNGPRSCLASGPSAVIRSGPGRNPRDGRTAYVRSPGVRPHNPINFKWIKLELVLSRDKASKLGTSLQTPPRLPNYKTLYVNKLNAWVDTASRTSKLTQLLAYQPSTYHHNIYWQQYPASQQALYHPSIHPSCLHNLHPIRKQSNVTKNHIQEPILRHDPPALPRAPTRPTPATPIIGLSRPDPSSAASTWRSGALC